MMRCDVEGTAVLGEIGAVQRETGADQRGGAGGQVRVLGPLEVRVGARALDLGGPRLRVLLALLTANVGRVVSVRALVEGVWGPDAPLDAQRTVRTYVSRMRRSLLPADEGTRQGGGMILTHPTGYSLRLEGDALDAVAFERLAAEGRALAVAGQPGAAVQRLSAALSLWRGDAYGEFADVPMLRPEATRLRQLRLHAVEDRIDAELAIGSGGALVGELLALTEQNPGHERLWGQLMIALWRAGRHAEALETFVRARAALVEQSGMEPSPELVEIHRQVLSHDPRLMGAQGGGGSIVNGAAPPLADHTGTPPVVHGGQAGIDRAGGSAIVRVGGPPSTPPGKPSSEPSSGPSSKPSSGPSSSATDGATAGATEGAAEGAAGRAAGRAAGGAPRPAQLPPDVAGFADRGRELAALDALLAAGPDRRGAVVCAVSGTAGVGKTTLAVHWAHRVAERFPDGQLYVNLRGFDPTGAAVGPAQAIRGFLDAFGMAAGGVPPGLEAQTGLYRSLLNGRRVLVVLDNARDAEQVRPLLPGAPGCLALVTSRNRLTSLAAVEGANLLIVDLLTAHEARNLLTDRLGARRVAAEPAAVDSIVQRCAGLPLALAIVAARAAAQPHLPLAALARELEETAGHLDTFDGGDPATEIRAVFACSYHALSEPAARLFRLLGLHPEHDIALPAAASLAGLPPARARALLAELARVHLVNEPAPGRYSLHDLLRTYAAELVATHEPDDTRRAATRRMLDHYLHTADTAGSVLLRKQSLITLGPAAPGTVLQPPADHGQALAWFNAEHPTLLALVERTPPGFDTHTWQLASTLTTFLDRQGHWPSLATAQSAALSVAQRQDDPAGQANAHLGLGHAHTASDRTRAAHHLQLALDLFGRLGNHSGQARTHQALAKILGAELRNREALDHSYRSLEHYLAADDPGGQAAALNNIGWFSAQLGDHVKALPHCRRALDLAKEGIDPNLQAHIWDSLGYIHHHLGEHQQALDCYRRALVLFRQTGDRKSTAIGLAYVGDTHSAAGDLAAARDAWGQALAIADELNLLDGDPLRIKIASRLRRWAVA